MSNLIFALESEQVLDINQEPVPYDENVVEPEAEQSILAKGIEQALESLQTLEKLRQIFKKNQGRPLSKSTIKIGRLAMERIKSDVGIFKDNLIVAQECFSEDSVSLEGIVDIAKSIWAAIVRTFKAIWNALTDFFSTRQSKVNRSEAKKNHENLKAAVHQITDERALQIQERKVSREALRNFRHLGEKAEITDLSAELVKLLKSIKIADGAIINLEVANVNMAEAIRRMKAEDFSEEATNGVFLAMGHYTSYIKDTFDHGEKSKLVDLIRSIDSGNSDKIDVDTIRFMDGISRGMGIVAYMYALDHQETTYHIRKVSLSDDEPNMEMPFPTGQALIHYSELVVKASEEGLDLKNHFEGKVKSIIGHQKTLLSGLDLLFQMEYFENRDSTENKDVIEFAQKVTRSLNKFSMDMTMIVRTLEVSVLDHTRVCSYFANAYKAK